MSQPPPTQTASGPTESATVYVSGSSPELTVVASALRLGTYSVVDLDPQSNELTTLSVRPCVLVADGSHDRAAALLRSVADLTDADRIDVVIVMDAGEPAPDASTVASPVHGYWRPLDVAAVIAKVSSLLADHVEENGPPSLPPDPEQGRSVYDSAAEDTPAPLSSPSPMGRIPTPSPLLSYAPAPWSASDGPPSSSNPPRSWPSSAPPGAQRSMRRAFAGPTSVSPDLEGLLASAEHRVFSEAFSSSDVPTPEEEVNAVLPPDVLAALDEPIDGEAAEEEAGDGSASRTPAGAGGTGSRGHTGTGSSVAYDAPVEPVTATGQEDPAPHAPTTGAHAYGAEPRGDGSTAGAFARRTSADDSEQAEEGAPFQESSMVEAPAMEPAMPELVVHAMRVEPTPVAHAIPVASQAPAPRTSARPSLPPVISRAFDGLQWLASCAAARTSGSACFEEGGVQRRAVLRDGDFVTCASSNPDESLVSYLLERGELPRDVTAYMATRVPPFGRHAAAALIAMGFLGQDQLWAVLRGHAEWVLARMVRASSGVGALETEPPGRLKAEPSVFGGATGAEVLVEVCRRTFAVDEAIDRLGGASATLATGRNASLLTECALDDHEHMVAEQVAGLSVNDAIERVGQPEFSTVLCALLALGAIEVLAQVRAAPSAAMPSAAEADRLDEEAVRQRIRARLALIEEGDYFQVLGVARTATPYEIRRAFVDGRRSFEPSRLLTAATADLADDAQLVVAVLEEAYEILRDDARRMRYLKALQAHPPSAP